jgi:hypothetical protein
MPTLDCSAYSENLGQSAVGACIAQLADKYPPTQAQIDYANAYTAYAQGCGLSNTSCNPGVCAGWVDGVYEQVEHCLPPQPADCDISVSSLCEQFAYYNMLVAACVAADQPDGGAADAGGG